MVAIASQDVQQDIIIKYIINDINVHISTSQYHSVFEIWIFVPVKPVISMYPSLSETVSEYVNTV